MKIIQEELKENLVTVIPQDSDDLYHLYHILNRGDRLKSKTSRKMKDTGDRISLFMEIEVEEVEFHGFGETIRVRGKIMAASEENVSLGSYHAITLELFKEVTIVKSQWFPSELDRLRNAQMGASSPVLVVAMDDERALVTQVGTHASKIMLDLDPGIPRKGHDPQGHMRATREFFDDLAIFLRNTKAEGDIRYVVIGGPGFTKDAFAVHVKTNYSELFVDMAIVEASSAGQSGVREIVMSKIPEQFTAGQSAKYQSELIEELLEYMGTDIDRIAYGSHLDRAIELGAVDRLLVLDELMHQTVEKRVQVEEYISKTQQVGGKTILMSSMHDVSNKEILLGLGGIVAFLRFSIN
ncbi:MAG: mRNA surveillance protein pelota [Candidatus Kariarchaeaceae archaeon]|jgi:protein pelota